MIQITTCSLSVNVKKKVRLPTNDELIKACEAYGNAALTLERDRHRYMNARDSELNTIRNECEVSRIELENKEAILKDMQKRLNDSITVILDSLKPF